MAFSCQFVILTLLYRSAKPTRIDSFLKLVSPFGLLESARSGLMALPRSPLFAPVKEKELEAEEVVDASQLPPG
jgi:acetolactate synthase-1/3 small subunit